MNPIKAQRGSTLLVALIMLVLLTLIAVSAINSTTNSIQIVGNAQFRDEARSISQQAIEMVISSDFTPSPAASSIAVDINKDGRIDYTANVSAPACTGSAPLLNSSLDRTNPLDQPCFSSSAAGQTGIMYVSGVPATTGTSWCLLQQWDIWATVNDSSSTGAKVDVHQGVGMRVPAGTMCN
ncbi:MAG: pilus assembly PilX N-terminal domain-containing protein [Nitrosomonadales bacterium]|nr:pilus assembly PilX N-terminal domain-containing protein [Nitrosomonadales bacterium]